MTDEQQTATLEVLREHALSMARDIYAFLDTVNEALAKLPAPESPQLRLPLGRMH